MVTSLFTVVGSCWEQPQENFCSQEEKKRWAGAVLGAEPLKEVVWRVSMCLGVSVFPPPGGKVKTG